MLKAPLKSNPVKLNLGEIEFKEYTSQEIANVQQKLLFTVCCL